MKSPLWLLFVALQFFHLLFDLLHDWLPLAIGMRSPLFKKSTTLRQKILSLLIPSAPVAFGLAFALLHTATSHSAASLPPFMDFYFSVNWRPGGFRMPSAPARSASRAIVHFLVPLIPSCRRATESRPTRFASRSTRQLWPRSSSSGRFSASQSCGQIVAALRFSGA